MTTDQKLTLRIDAWAKDAVERASHACGYEVADAYRYYLTVLSRLSEETRRTVVNRERRYKSAIEGLTTQIQAIHEALETVNRQFGEEYDVINKITRTLADANVTWDPTIELPKRKVHYSLLLPSQLMEMIEENATSIGVKKSEFLRSAVFLFARMEGSHQTQILHLGRYLSTVTPEIQESLLSDNASDEEFPQQSKMLTLFTETYQWDEKLETVLDEFRGISNTLNKCKRHISELLNQEEAK